MDFKFVGKALNYLPSKLSDKVSEEVSEKTNVALLSALQLLDKQTPILTTLLAGGKIEARITIQLIDTDGQSIK